MSMMPVCFMGFFLLSCACRRSWLFVKRRARLLKARHGSFPTEGLLSPNIPPSNGPLHRPQVTSSYNCFASEYSVVLQAAEDIQLLLTAKEADKVTRRWRAFMLPWVHVCL